MKTKFLLFLIFVCAPYLGKAQNLVPNGGFEEVINCPTTYSALQDDCANWFGSIQIPGNEPNENPSPDWFHTCGIGDPLTPPTVAFGGYQVPWDGNAYAGFATYASTSAEYREIIAVELFEALQLGHTYNVSFYVTKGTSDGASLASNNVGVKFTTQAIFTANEQIINNMDHFHVDSLITDTTNWVHLEFNFTADQEYSYLQIGNFYDDENTLLQLGLPFEYAAYYLIDGVSVIEMPTSVNDAEALNLSIYPNPVKELLNITSEHIWNKYEISDLSGKVFRQGLLRPEKAFNILVNNLDEGIYLLRLKDKFENQVYKKFIKI